MQLPRRLTSLHCTGAPNLPLSNISLVIVTPAATSRQVVSSPDRSDSRPDQCPDACKNAIHGYASVVQIAAAEEDGATPCEGEQHYGVAHHCSHPRSNRFLGSEGIGR